MIPRELFQKVRRIQISSNRLVTDIFAGQYHSVFKGRGMEFDEVREYQRGDDIRTIDWNVTARTGVAHVKKYVEERELTVMLLVDMSRSCRCGSAGQLKSQLAAEISALLALSAIRNNDKVGLIIFTDQIEKFIPPRKGSSHVLRVIREVLYFEPQGRATDLAAALEFLARVASRRAVSFVFSDFVTGSAGEQESLRRALSITNQRHDLIAVTLNDPLEQAFPRAGLLSLEDAETGTIRTVDTMDSAVREAFRQQMQARVSQRQRLLQRCGIDSIDVMTNESYTKSLIKFFAKRRRRLAV